MDRVATGLQVMVNGERIATGAATLGELLVERGYAGLKVATALNGAFVPERRRGDTRLSAGDAVEIVGPRQGG